MELIDFLHARLDEDEQVARAAAEMNPAPWHVRYEGWVEGSAENKDNPMADTGLWDCEGAGSLCMATSTAVHVARHDPARVLAEVEAKRRIVELHAHDHECSTFNHNGDIDSCTWVTGDCSTLHLLAQVYDQHPDYQPEWKP